MTSKVEKIEQAAQPDPSVVCSLAELCLQQCPALMGANRQIREHALARVPGELRGPQPSATNSQRSLCCQGVSVGTEMGADVILRQRAASRASTV